MKKATMLIENTMGVIVLRHITLDSIEQDQKDESKVNILYKMKGARKTKGFKLSKKETQLVLAEGWQIPEGMDKCTRYANTWGYDSFVQFETARFKSTMNKLNNVFYSHID